MAKWKFKTVVWLPAVVVVLFLACVPRQEVSQYIQYTKKMEQLIKAGKHDTDLAGAAVLKYVTLNQDAIETTLKTLNSYTVKQTEENYNKVMQPVLEIKKLLSNKQKIYPDAIRKEINKVLIENQAVVDEQTGLLKETASYFLKALFAPVAAKLLTIKQLAEETPPEQFHLSKNPDFVKALEIMHIANLVLP